MYISELLRTGVPASQAIPRFLCNWLVRLFLPFNGLFFLFFVLGFWSLAGKHEI